MDISIWEAGKMCSQLSSESPFAKRKFSVSGKEITLYPAMQADRPLIVLNTYTGDGESVMREVRKISAGDVNVLVIGNLDWNHDMTPWYCPPLSADDTAATGGADEYLELLLSEILPKARTLICGTPTRTCIAGYSLAGLFALYAMYRCDAFERAASISGSLWFPDFLEFAAGHDMLRKPDRIYLSLGDKEKKTRHPLLKTVQDNTEALAEHYRQLGIEVTFELNPGNHFQDAALRSAKGMTAI